jgi:glycine amidinotransferase
VHEVRFREAHPMHIDASFVPVRPGLVITNTKRIPLTKELVELCKLNDWELVECAKPAHTQPPPLSFCSIWLSMNVLVLDPKTVCVEEAEKEQMEQFDKLGFEVIPVPFWDVSAFGGGLHCATADVYREGTLQDYFPKQIPGY